MKRFLLLVLLSVLLFGFKQNTTTRFLDTDPDFGTIARLKAPLNTRPVFEQYDRVVHIFSPYKYGYIVWIKYAERIPGEAFIGDQYYVRWYDDLHSDDGVWQTRLYYEWELKSKVYKEEDNGEK